MRTTSNLLRTVTFMLVASLCSSCCTRSLWQSTDPDEYIEVSFDEMTEEALKEDGFSYRRDDGKQLFFIEKDPSQRFINYASRVLGTPITVAADTFLTGLMAYGLAISEISTGGVSVDKALAEWGYY